MTIYLCQASELPVATHLQKVKTRVVVLADMGNEPDEEQQVIHLLLYSNMMDIQGFIAVTGKYLRPESTEAYKRKLHPELFYKIIDRYEQDYPNLKKHADGWPTAESLRSVVFSGQAGYGIESTGKGQSTPGSAKIESLLTNNDSRPLYIVVNAGSNTLAQALVDLERKLTQTEFLAAIAKLRVYENGAQDNAGAWIMANYPSIHWMRSNFQTYGFGGPSWRSTPLAAQYPGWG